MKKERKIAGVTMVALVVTIIIMLILAGIVITLTLGDKGILTRAKQATELYKEAEINEQLQLSNLSNEIKSHSNNKSTDISEIADSLKTEIISSIYPIGSIYMSTEVSTVEEVSQKLGGEWEQIKDTFLLSAGDTYEAGTTGGEAEHTLTVAEMPSHSHLFGANFGSANPIGNDFSNIGQGPFYLSGKTFNTDSAGGSQAHNNMPPYLTVYMYKRIN